MIHHSVIEGGIKIVTGKNMNDLFSCIIDRMNIHISMTSSINLDS